MSHLLALLVLFADAEAKEPPSRPEPNKQVKGQCSEAIPFREGDTALCKGLLMPTSWIADYELTEAYADKLAKLYRIDTMELEYELRLTQAMLQRELQPVPVWERKTTWTGIGAVLGAASVIGGGYVIMVASERNSK
jgi:hypothetical protein